MKIYVRADSSVQIGSGHVMRCLTLADTLVEKGASISFICRAIPGNLCNLIERKGYQVHRLPYREEENNFRDDIDAEETEVILKKEANVQWLIVDHYALGQQWEIRMRPLVRKIMVIDDLADRHHDCDVLLDQNLYQDMDTRYDGLVPAQCKKLLGPEFALLRPEFLEARKNQRLRDGSVKRVLVFFGGSDPTKETQKALDAIRLLNMPDIIFDVVIGIANQYKDSIKRVCESLPNTLYYCQIDNMAELLNNADLSIGAGGATTWERCCLSVPSIVISVAENQVGIAKAADAAGTVMYLGPSGLVTAHDIAKQLRLIILDPNRVIKLSRDGARLVDGLGTERVLTALMTTK